MVVAVVVAAALLGSGVVAAVVSAIVTALLICAVVVVVLAAAAVVLAVVVKRRRRARYGPSVILAPYWRAELRPPPSQARELPAAQPAVVRVLRPAARPVCQARPGDRRRKGGTPC